MRVLQVSVVAPNGPQGLLSPGRLLTINRDLVLALDGHVKELILLVRRQLERVAGNIQRPIRRSISASICRKNRHPVLRVPVEGVDLFRLRVDIDSAYHLGLGVCSRNDPLGFCETNSGRSTFSTVVLHDSKHIFVRDHKHVAVGIDRHGAETRIRIFDETQRRPLDNYGFPLRLSLRENSVSQPNQNAG